MPAPLFLNREIGWLKFNQRVLFQAKDDRSPLLERIRFMNIFHSNLDEFFMKRVGGLERQFFVNLASLSPDGLTPEEQPKLIRDRVLSFNIDPKPLLSDIMLPELRRNQIHLLTWSELMDSEKAWATQFF